MTSGAMSDILCTLPNGTPDALSSNPRSGNEGINI
jgi:hypothetical protein